MLPEPYYDKDGITIYHGDCRDILPLLPKVDLVLTDPPYGIGYQSCHTPSWRRKKKIEGDGDFPMWLFEYVPLVATLVWCRWDNLYAIPKPKSFICWDKGNHSMGDLNHEFGRRWEGCAFYPGENHQFAHRPADMIIAARVPPAQMRHPTEKPVNAITPLIACHVCETILDPFMGSGTTLVAAKLLGKKAIGIELEEEYCKIAVERLAQGNLFGECR